jgi:hypothetical protein
VDISRFEKTKPIWRKGKSKKAKGKMRINPDGLFEKTKPMLIWAKCG